MALAPATWSKFVEDERTRIIVEPFVGFFDVGGVDPHEIPDDIEDLLDAEAALIPRMILILRKLARIREAAGRPAPPVRRNKIGATIHALAGRERNTNAAALAPDREIQLDAVRSKSRSDVRSQGRERARSPASEERREEDGRAWVEAEPIGRR